MGDKCSKFSQKDGRHERIASVVVWFRSYYPRTDDRRNREAHHEKSHLAGWAKAPELGIQPSGLTVLRGVASGLPGQGDRGPTLMRV